MLLLIVRFAILNTDITSLLWRFRWRSRLCTLPSTPFSLHVIATFTCRFRHVLIEFCWSINMWNKIFQRINLLIIQLSLWVLPKGHQSSQSTTMLHNECTHTFLYVFGHCGKYMLGLLLIFISKSSGGVSFAFLFAGAVFLLEVFSQASSQ
jgi:hypothetical protein